MHLVRHGRPLIKPGVPASDWQLDQSSSVQLTALRESGVLPSQGCWTSSPEPKALATARALADELVTVDDDLREAFRPAGWVSKGEFERRVVASMTDLEHPGAEGWETGAATAARARAAVSRALDRPGGDDLVLVGHGTSLTLLVAELLGQPPDVAAWRHLLMPDHCAIDVEVRRVLSPWGAWTAALD